MCECFDHAPLILALTGHTETSYVKKALASGMDNVLNKPLDPKIAAEFLF